MERGERAVVGDRVVDHDRVERRQLLPRRADDADRAVADSLAHDRDRVLDGRLPVPVEQRLGLAHPARPAAGENDRARPACQPGSRACTCWKPKRPLMQRFPRVTSWSSGLVTLTIVLSCTCSSRLQPTPQYGHTVVVTT